MNAQNVFSETLKHWRGTRGTSQLALAQIAGISSRHLSFLETGRSKPSRRMIHRLAEALDLPLRARNDLLLGAGFAPRYGERLLEDEEMAPIREALAFVLRMHEPYPAFVLDRRWDIVLWNRTHEQLIQTFLSGAGPDGLNALDLVFQPGLLREHILNWQEVAITLLRRLRRQVSGASHDAELQALWQRTRRTPGVEAIPEELTWDRPAILVPLKLQLGEQTLSWFSTLAVFGAAGDVTVEELVVEQFFPADEDTRRFVESMGQA